MKHKINIAIGLLLPVAIYFLVPNEERYVWMLAVLCCTVSVIAYGSSHIGVNYFINSVNKTGSPGITLTFDDGPHPVITPRILEVLEKNQIKAVFFVIGKHARQYPELVKQMHRQGHVVANHSYSHSVFLPLFSSKKLHRDIEECSKILEQQIGQKVTLFRPPFGVTNPRFKKVLADLRLTSVGWNIRSLDTVIKQPEALLERISKRLAPGSILLLHDNQEVTLQALPLIIDYCTGAGLPIVPWASHTHQAEFYVK